MDRRSFLLALLLPCSSFASPASEITLRMFVGDGGHRDNTDPNRDHLIVLAQWLGAQCNIKFEVERLPWPRALAMAQTGEGAILGVTKTAEREKSMDFSIPIFTNKVWAILRADDPSRIENVNSLAGKTVSVFRGGSFGKEFEAARDKIFTIEEDPSNVVSRFDKLREKRCDVMLYSHRFNDVDRVSKALERRGFSTESFRIAPKPIFNDPVHFAISRNRDTSTVLARVNDAINRGHASGELDKIVQQDYRS